MALVDAVDDEESLATEQAALEYLDTVEDLGTRIQTLIDTTDKQADKRKVITRRLSHL